MQRAPLATIFSTGRSGSTWLGSIIDTHPEVAYRFEPLARLREDREIRGLKARIGNSRSDATLLTDLHRRLLRAEPLTYKPPFFPKRNQRTRGREWLWPAARTFLPARALFRAAYTADAAATVVFKEVGMNRQVLPLVRDAQLRAIYLVRHPCAVVSSILAGQEANLLPTGRRSVIAGLLEKHDRELAAQWSERLPDASGAELEALLWRIDVEETLRALGDADHVRLVIYEDLCRRPAAIADELFAHLGLPPSEQTSRLLNQMSSAGASTRRARGDRWANEYFSVFRDSVESADKWKRALPDSSIREVLRAVADSPAFQRCAVAGGW